MPKKSTRENKTIYHKIREEELGWSREKAAEELGTISSDRLEKVEKELSPIRPDEVVLMAETYKHPELCYNYCAYDCEIGKRISHEITVRDLASITVDMLASLQRIDNDKGRLIEIVADGQVDEDEIEDFKKIQENLDHISMVASSLKLWTAKMVAEGKIKES